MMLMHDGLLRTLDLDLRSHAAFVPSLQIAVAAPLGRTS
jgi:hypothetical protein